MLRIVISILFKLFLFLGFVPMICTSAANERLADSASYLTEDYLRTPSFKSLIIDIVEDTRKEDLACKERHGNFWYYSFTNQCEDCALYCNPPTEGMKTICLDKCENYMVHRKVEEVQIRQQRKIESLEDESEEMRNEIRSLKNMIVVVIACFISAILILFAGFIVSGILYHRYVTTKYAPVRRMDATPESDARSICPDHGYGGSAEQTPLHSRGNMTSNV